MSTRIHYVTIVYLEQHVHENVIIVIMTIIFLKFYPVYEVISFLKVHLTDEDFFIYCYKYLLTYNIFSFCSVL